MRRSVEWLKSMAYGSGTVSTWLVATMQGGSAHKQRNGEGDNVPDIQAIDYQRRSDQRHNKGSEQIQVNTRLLPNSSRSGGGGKGGGVGEFEDLHPDVDDDGDGYAS